MAKIQDVARAANVSVSTVCRAFREDSSISPETRRMILAAANEMGYYPNLLARGLKSNKSKVVGIVGSIETPFYVDIIKAIESELQKYGYQVLLGTSVHCQERERHYLELMASSWVSGIIMTPFLEEPNSYIDQIHKRGIPVVQLFRRPYDFLDSVVIDDENGAYLAVNDLLNKGHTRILLFDIPVSHAYQRSDGYRKAFREKGLPVDENLIVITANERIPQTIEELKPTAVVTSVYEQGRLVYQYIKEKRLHIPEDLSVIMLDNVEWMEILDINTIAQPIDYIGVSASRLLMDRMEEKKNDPISLVLQPRYMVRSSVKAIK